METQSVDNAANQQESCELIPITPAKGDAGPLIGRLEDISTPFVIHGPARVEADRAGRIAAALDYPASKQHDRRPQPWRTSPR